MNTSQVTFLFDITSSRKLSPVSFKFLTLEKTKNPSRVRESIRGVFKEYNNDIAEIQYANEKHYEKLRDEFDHAQTCPSEKSLLTRLLLFSFAYN